MKDLQGNTYATVKEVTVGTKLRVDGDFTCMRKDSVHEVHKDEVGELYVLCADGRHFLDGQTETDNQEEYYLGMYIAEEVA